MRRGDLARGRPREPREREERLSSGRRRRPALLAGAGLRDVSPDESSREIASRGDLARGHLAGGDPLSRGARRERRRGSLDDGGGDRGPAGSLRRASSGGAADARRRPPASRGRLLRPLPCPWCPPPRTRHRPRDPKTARRLRARPPASSFFRVRQSFGVQGVGARVLADAPMRRGGQRTLLSSEGGEGLRVDTTVGRAGAVRRCRKTAVVMVLRRTRGSFVFCRAEVRPGCFRFLLVGAPAGDVRVGTQLQIVTKRGRNDLKESFLSTFNDKKKNEGSLQAKNGGVEPTPTKKFEGETALASQRCHFSCLSLIMRPLEFCFC